MVIRPRNDFLFIELHATDGTVMPEESIHTSDLLYVPYFHHLHGRGYHERNQNHARGKRVALSIDPVTMVFPFNFTDEIGHTVTGVHLCKSAMSNALDPHKPPEVPHH